MERNQKDYILANLGKIPVRQIARDLDLKERKVKKFIELHKREAAVRGAASGSARAAAPAGEGPFAETFFRRAFLPAALLSGLAAYANTLRSAFHLDDLVVIVNNSTIKDLAHPRAIFDEFNTRALVGFSFALNYALHKLDVTGYHLVNIAVHLGAAAFVWALVLALFRTPALSKGPLAAHRHLLAFFSGLIFLLHPVQTQGVTYIWQRSASMAAFFYLGAVWSYVRARTGSGLPAYAAAAFFCLAAMFTKEISATLPLALVLVEAVFFASEPLAARARRAAPFLLLLAVIPVTYLRPRNVSLSFFFSPRTEQAVSAGAAPAGKTLTNLTRWESAENMSRSEYYLTELNVIRTYLRLLVWPARQSVVYAYPRAKSLAEPAVIVSLLAHLGLLALALRWRRRRPLEAFGILWFYLTLSVESAVPLPDVIFEHRVSLPLAGFALFLPPALLALVRRPRAAAAALAAVTLLFAFAAGARNAVWKDDFTLWGDTAKKFPDDPRAYNELGNAYGKVQDYTKAREYFERALAAGGGRGQDYGNIGAAYLDQGDPDKALEYFEKAIAEAERRSDGYALGAAYSNAAKVYGMRGDRAKAAEWYAKAIQADPSIVQPYANLCVLYIESGDLGRAIEYGEKALRVNPDFPDARYSLGVAYRRAGRPEDARAQVAALRALGAEEQADRLEKTLS